MLRLSLSLIIILLLPGLALASGTYVPPPIPDNFKDIPVNEKIKMGKALFNGRPYADIKPVPGAPCVECHKGSNRLRRKHLKKIREKLEETIAKEYLKRYKKEGDPLAVKSIYYYMYIRWRLSR